MEVIGSKVENERQRVFLQEGSSQFQTLRPPEPNQFLQLFLWFVSLLFFFLKKYFTYLVLYFWLCWAVYFGCSAGAFSSCI